MPAKRFRRACVLPVDFRRQPAHTTRSLMFGDAFAAVEESALGTARNRLAPGMVMTALREQRWGRRRHGVGRTAGARLRESITRNNPVSATISANPAKTQ